MDSVERESHRGQATHQTTQGVSVSWFRCESQHLGCRFYPSKGTVLNDVVIPGRMSNRIHDCTAFSRAHIAFSVSKSYTHKVYQEVRRGRMQAVAESLILVKGLFIFFFFYSRDNDCTVRLTKRIVRTKLRVRKTLLITLLILFQCVNRNGYIFPLQVFSVRNGAERKSRDGSRDRI